ncbi:MAG: hypothetical protein CMB32_02580 [Euryarchaeota archaeon]|nr:hypothetical protein [Euryarchaeota archaeon]
MRRYYLILFTLLYSSIAISQTFQDGAPGYGITQYNWDGLFGAGVTAGDWNRDGLDDLVFGNSEGAVRVWTNNGDGFDMMPLPLTQIAETKAIQWVDVDEDYDLDFFLTDRFGKMYLLENINDTAFVNVSANAGFPNDSVSAAGASWGDYDNDGDLDVHICRYVENPFVTEAMYRNVLLRNNGDLTFTDVSSEAQIDLYIRLSFQSIWYDWDQDGWMDLYVINDKNGANALYHNQQNGQFAEIASSVGADVVLDAMTASMGDFNQDGYQDIFMTSTVIGNNGIGSLLLVGSEDGQYEEASADYGLNFQRYCWGAAWMDVDNDTDLDLFVAESEPLEPFQENYLYKNNGPFIANPPFTEEDGDYVMEPFGENVYGLDYLNSYTVVSGDFDRNGWIDFVVHNKGNHKARMWMNSGFNDDAPKYLQIGVQGTVSNTMGIGAVVEVIDNGLNQKRVIHCGENYLGQESFYEHFGLDDFTDQTPYVDQIKIKWPSGIVDSWSDVEIGERILYVEGSSPCDNFDNSTVDLCLGEIAEFEIEVDWNGSSVVWVDEDGVEVGVGNEYTAESPGMYTASVLYESTEVCSVTTEVLGLELGSDIDGSGYVGSNDLLEFLATYGCETGCASDVNGDGYTTVHDLLQLLIDFGQGC